MTTAEDIATSTPPRVDRSASPKTRPRSSPGMKSGHAFPNDEGEIGPPRSGFVLRSCIRKAEGAWGETAIGHGLADTTFCSLRNVGPLLCGW
jgi:hypothetical protein